MKSIKRPTSTGKRILVTIHRSPTILHHTGNGSKLTMLGEGGTGYLKRRYEENLNDLGIFSTVEKTMSEEILNDFEVCFTVQQTLEQELLMKQLTKYVYQVRDTLFDCPLSSTIGAIFEDKDGAETMFLNCIPLPDSDGKIRLYLKLATDEEESDRVEE